MAFPTGCVPNKEHLQMHGLSMTNIAAEQGTDHCPICMSPISDDNLVRHYAEGNTVWLEYICPECKSDFGNYYNLMYTRIYKDARFEEVQA